MFEINESTKCHYIVIFFNVHTVPRGSGALVSGG